RGTPPAVIETDAATFMEMINGQLSWKAAVGGHRVAASGAHADLSDLFPEPAAQADGT
ncbi:MAG: sterol carrier family protein, partial [Propionibacteriaceae bacterium]|nr:sterol carrier family protein [Propionibacteriaceae bacterium]